jgi:hypothetical protein
MRKILGKEQHQLRRYSAAGEPAPCSETELHRDLGPHGAEKIIGVYGTRRIDQRIVYLVPAALRQDIDDLPPEDRSRLWRRRGLREQRGQHIIETQSVASTRSRTAAPDLPGPRILNRNQHGGKSRFTVKAVLF